MIMSRQLRRISIIFMLIVSIQILCGLNATIEATQSHSIYDVQEKLTEKGYDPGQIDGIMGIKTSAALKKFQKDKGLPVSAKLDIETGKKLFEESKGNPDHTEDSAISSESATTMKHTKPDFFVADQRIQLQTEVEDLAGIKLVRCYFKAAGEADMVFVPMNSTAKIEYAGVLPAPSKATTQIEYLFLAVNNSCQVVRSQTFTIIKNENKKTPSWQEIPKEGEIKVSMDLDKVPTQLHGFSDNVNIDEVESGARFGVVALLYHGNTSSAVASSASATGATSAGTITAGSAGWSTAVIVGIGVGAAAVAGGTAAAVGGGGGGDGDEKMNSIASVSWGDDDAPVGDAFQVIVGGKDIGENPTSGNIGVKTETGFPVGDYDLIINCVSALADEGNYIIDLSGGAFFKEDQSTHKQGTLWEGESRTYPIHIPEIADTTIRW